jgi:hypothetical protein
MRAYDPDERGGCEDGGHEGQDGSCVSLKYEVRSLNATDFRLQTSDFKLYALPPLPPYCVAYVPLRFPCSH